MHKNRDCAHRVNLLPTCHEKAVQVTEKWSLENGMEAHKEPHRKQRQKLLATEGHQHPWPGHSRQRKHGSQRIETLVWTLAGKGKKLTFDEEEPG